MPISLDEWASIRTLAERVVAQNGGGQQIMTTKVAKVDPDRKVIYVPELGDQPIPVVDFETYMRNYDHDVPVGSIMQTSDDVPPENYLLANGQEVNRADYAELFAVIGTDYGVGNGSTTFNVPLAVFGGGGGGAPSGPAGGDLSGTYPNPQIASGIIVNADVNASAAIVKSKLAPLAIVNTDVDAAAAIAESKLSLASDAVPATPSRRTLGTGAQQAAAGNDSRFTDSRAPSGTASGDLSGTYPSPQIAAGVITDADVNAANKDGAAGTASMRTLGSGATQAMPGNTTHATMSGTVAVVQGGTGQTTAKAARETGLGSVGYYSSATHGAGTSISVTAAMHGLRASRGLLVQVQDEATGNVEISDISVAANGDVTVTFGVSISANTKRITVIG